MISTGVGVGDCEDMGHGTGSWHQIRSGEAARSRKQPIAAAPLLR
jgi:hypothetical protein